MDYLFKASAVLLIFFICYKLFLQKDTFFKENRLFLLIGILVSLILPTIVIPINVEYTPSTLGYLATETTTSGQSLDTEETTISISAILWWVYGLGFSIFLIKFLFEIISLSHLIRTSEVTKEGRYKFTKVRKPIAPFSFFNWIVLNPLQFLPQELNLIIKHEKVHVRQLHSLDLICAQLLCIVLWFNPFVWLYKNALNQNLEFIADNDTQQSISCYKSYQELLLKTSIRGYNVSITNNFYNSLIKKRIVMLHKNKSNHYSKIKLAIILPLLAAFLVGFNTKTVYIEKESTPTSTSYSLDNLLMEPNYVFNSNSNGSAIAQSNTTAKLKPKVSLPSKDKKTDKTAITLPNNVVIISKEASDNDLDKIKDQLKKQGIIITFKSVKRNKKGEITAIKITAKSENSEVKYSSKDDDAIEPITIKFSDDGISIGNGKKSKHKNDYVFVTGKAKHKKHNSNSVMVYSSDDHNDVHEDIQITNYKNYLFIKDGETISVDELEKIYPSLVKSNTIATFDVLKGKKALEVYGDDAKNGVVVITTGEPRKGNYFFHLEDDEENEEHEDTNIWITKNGKKHKVKASGTSKIILHSDDDEDEKEVVIVESIPQKKVIVIGEPNEEEEVEEIIVEGKGVKVWTTDDDVVINKIGKDKKSFFFVTSDDDNNGKDPLFILNGKEISKKDMKDINPEKIDSITVLKDEKAIEKYGDKGKNGVIEIKTKKE